MDKRTISHLRQFDRGVHQPLPKSDKTSPTEWMSNANFRIHDVSNADRPWGHRDSHPLSNDLRNIDSERVQIDTVFEPKIKQFVFTYKCRSTGKSMTATDIFRQNYELLLKKYPKPSSSSTQTHFLQKASVPRGMSNEHPYGNPTVRFFGHRLLGGIVIRPVERELIENWINHLAGPAWLVRKNKKNTSVNSS